MATFYKGAGIGTHWHTNDPRNIGFTPRSPESMSDTQAVIDHITRSTADSPYTSLTRSYGVAWDYAMEGVSEMPVPSQEIPAYIYKIEINNSLKQDLKLIDPIREVAQSLIDPNEIGFQNEGSFYQHNGLRNFLLSLVDPQNMLEYRIGRLPTPPGPGEICDAILSPELNSLVFALRDAEILVYGEIPADCVKNRFEVVYENSN